MKVLLIGNLPTDRQTSMLLFQAAIERELRRLGHEVRLITAQPLALRLPHPKRLRKWMSYIDKFVIFALLIRKHLQWAEVVHITDHSNAMYVPRVLTRPNIVTCHDVIAIQAAIGRIENWHVGYLGRIFQRLISKGLGRADAVVCVSQLTRRDLLELKITDEPRVCVVDNSLNADFRPLSQERADTLTRRLGVSSTDRYLMHVGQDLDRKNRTIVLGTFIELQRRARNTGASPPVDKLIFVGPPLNSEMTELARAGGVATQVGTVQDVQHETLCALYSNAVALLFPSLHEGFGWPIIEAQACGCPVFTSDRAPMNEIGGEGPVYVEPTDAAAIATAIERSMPTLARMRDQGLDNAAQYRSERMAIGYVSIYGRVISERERARQ